MEKYYRIEDGGDDYYVLAETAGEAREIAGSQFAYPLDGREVNTYHVTKQEAMFRKHHPANSHIVNF